MAPPEVMTALTQQIAENSKDLNAFVSDRILRSVGGDKRAAGYMQSFVYGTELSQGTAAEAMTYFALKGNLPAGLSLTPEARQVFGKAQKLVEEHRADRVGGKQISESCIAGNCDSRTYAVRSEDHGASASRQTVFNDLPGVAQQTGHPFGKFPDAALGRDSCRVSSNGRRSCRA
jgi:hypothetical protein